MGDGEATIQRDEGSVGEVRVRPAEPSDAAALAELERSTPIVVGDERLVYDRSRDYFAYARLMEDCDVVLAEVDGQVVGVHSAAFHHVRLGGVEQRLNYVHHLRVWPGNQGKGVVPELKKLATSRYPRPVSGSYAYVDARNTSVSDRMAEVPDYHRWPVSPSLFELDTAALAGGPAARSAQPDDAAAICDLLNTAHDHKELWHGATPERLSARLGRAPDLYGWEDVRLTSDAAVGVWRAGRGLDVIREGPEGRTVTSPAIVLDYGHRPSGENAVVDLLRGWADELAGEGLDRVLVFATTGGPLARLLEPLATNVRTFDFWTVRLPVPEGDVDLYVDPVYF